MLPKEYRIPMPISVEEYRVGQLYMIAKHSNQNTGKSEGIEVIHNHPIEDETQGSGQYTEKRIHLGGSLPSWMRAMIPRFFYITEKAWNYFPYTVTEFTCSFIPKFHIRVLTRYENNSGNNDQCMAPSLDKDGKEVPREVEVIDIVHDEIPEKHREECINLKEFVSEKTGRGPWQDKDWPTQSTPMMCSYKVVETRFEVWGLQSRVERFMHKSVRDVLLVGHNQAVGWLDEWHGMTMEELREYERQQQAEANTKIGKKKEEEGAEEPLAQQDSESASAAASPAPRTASV